MTQPRIVTWRAVSTEDQAEKESLDYQHRLNLEHAARWNGMIVANLEVPGVTRSIVLWEDACRAIDAYAQLDALIERKAFDILMCMDVTRLGRDRALVVTTAALLERAGIRVYETSSPPPSLDGPHSTPDTRLLMMLKGHMSEEEVRKFKERTMFGRQAMVKKGKHQSNRPSGLKCVYDEKGKSSTVVDEEWRPLILLFYDLYINHGRSLNDIYREFNARGILIPGTGRQWNHGSVRVFLRNRWAYAGYVTWGNYSLPEEKRIRSKAEWEGVITEEQVRFVEKEMKQRYTYPRGTYGPHRFSMVAKCNICGATLVAHSRPLRGGVLADVFACKKRCKGTYIRESEFVDAVRAAIIALADEANLEELAGETPDEYPEMLRMAEETKRQLDGVRKERANLTRAFTREVIELDEYEAMMKELKQRHDDLAVALTQLEDRIASTPTTEKRMASLEDIVSHGLAMLDHPDAATACVFLRRHCTIRVEGGKVVSVELH